MTSIGGEPLGTERIVVTPDTTAFRAQLEAQVAAALASVQGQIKAAKVTSAAGTTSAGGVILPAGVGRAVATQKELAVSSGQAAAAQKDLGAAVGTTAAQENTAAAATERLAVANTSGAAAMARQTREIKSAETSLGRLTRGSVAAAAASSGIFRAISFASGAFLVGAAAGGAAAAGLQEFSEKAKVAATTAQLIESTGHAANLTAEQITSLANAQLKLTGVDDELIQSGENVLLTFRNIRDEVGAGNQVFTRASKAALDVSQVLGTSLRSTAIQLGKALQDPVRGITALRRSGISFTQDQRATITTLTETGRTLEAQKLILAEVERQVGGTATAIGRTLPGRLNILKESARNALGDYVQRLQDSEDASKAAAGGAEVLRSAFNAVRTSLGAVGPQLVGIGEGLGRATRGVGGPQTLLAVAAGYTAVKVAVSAGTGAFALYSAATTTAARDNLALAASSEAGVTPALEKQAAAETAAGVAARKRIGSITLLTGALAVGSAASGQWTSSMLLGATAMTGFGTRALGAFRAARQGGTALRLLSGAAGALGGPLGIATVGVGALAGIIYLLHRRASQATGTLKGFQRAIDPLSKSLEHLQGVQERIATQSENITLGRLDVRTAQRQVDATAAALAGSNAPAGSVNRLGLEALAAKARDDLREATRKLRVEEDNLAQSRREQDAIARARPALIAQQTQALRNQLEGIRQSAGQNLANVPLLVGRAGVGSVSGAERREREQQIEDRAKAIQAATKVLDTLSRSGDAAQRALALPLKGVIDQLDRLPTRKETQIAVKLVAQGATIDEIFAALGIRPPKTSGTAAATQAQALAIQRRAALVATVRGERLELRPLEEEFQKRRAILRTAQDQVKAAQDSVKAAQDQVQASQESLVAARDQLAASKQAVGAAREQRVEAVRALADAREQARLSRQALNETVRDAKQAVRQAVNDAKGNLNQLAEAIGSTLNQVAGNVQRRGNLGETFRRLREQILTSRGPEAQGAQAALGFRVNAAQQTTPGNDLAIKLTDLSNAFNFGRIKAPAFLREFNKVVAGFDPKVIRAKLGGLATDTLLGQITAARNQPALIAAGPRVPGGGVAANVVSPAQAQVDAAKQIAAAQRDLRGSLRGIADAQRGVVKADEGIQSAIKDVARAQTALGKSERDRARADRELAAARRRESAAETKASKRLADVTEQHRLVMVQLLKVQQARNRLDRAKPQGKANQKTTNATTHGVLAAE